LLIAVKASPSITSQKMAMQKRIAFRVWLMIFWLRQPVMLKS